MINVVATIDAHLQEKQKTLNTMYQYPHSDNINEAVFDLKKDEDTKIHITIWQNCKCKASKSENPWTVKGAKQWDLKTFDTIRESVQVIQTKLLKLARHGRESKSFNYIHEQILYSIYYIILLALIP